MSKRSVMWLYFSVVDDNKKIAKCDVCKQTLCYKHSVSNLKKHFKRKHPDINVDNTNTQPKSNRNDNRANINPVVADITDNLEDNSHDATNAMSSSGATYNFANRDSDGPSTSFSSNSSTIRRQDNISSYMSKKLSKNSKHKLDADLLDLFICDFQPFSIVDDRGFRKFVQNLNPSYNLPNRHTISDTLLPLEYNKCLQEAKQQIKDIVNICLTTDCWTSAKNENFMAVTGHFIDSEFKMNSVLLNCDKMDLNHTALNLSAQLKAVVQEWDLENKVILVVSDNASNITSAVKNKLGWKHFGCFAHTLNLIVQDSLKLVDELKTKVKTIVGHFRRSPLANGKLENFQKQFGMEPPKKLIQDVPTRWNSTFYMFQRFVELENPIRSVLGLLDTALPQLSVDEWILIKQLCEVLKYFEEATKSVSGENYMSASLVIVLQGGLLSVCEKVKLAGLLDQTLSVVECLETGLKNRVGNVEYSNTLAVCTFLDPRFKGFAFKNQDALESIKNTVTTIVQEMVNRSTKKNSKITLKLVIVSCKKKVVKAKNRKLFHYGAALKKNWQPINQKLQL